MIERLTSNVFPVGACVFLGEAGGDPGRRSNPSIQFGNFVGNVRCYLDATAADTYDGHSFALQSYLLVPICRVTHFALEVV